MRRMVQITLAIFLLLPAAYSQQVTGAITGSVLDSTGAAIGGAEVRVRSTDTGVARTAASGEDGTFRILQLPPGVYTVEASQAGFKSFRRDGVVVEADRSLAVPVALEVGAVTEVVEVSAGTPLLEPNSSSLGTVMDQNKVDSLPLNGRNPLGLANLIPTVRGIGFFGGQVLSSWRLAAVGIGGGPPLSNGVQIDGIAADKMYTSGSQTFLTVDSTQEFKILTNSMAAEFGRTAGGIISMVSRSGTNNFHGNLFEFLRNSALNANDYFANAAGRARPSLVWNQFGGSIGGPIRRDKLFFFANYEGFRERRVSQRILTSPTALERAGDFSDTRVRTGQMIVIHDPTTTRANPAGGFVRDPFPGNRVPASAMSRVGRSVLEYIPLPNLPGQEFTRAQNLFLQAGGPIDRNTITGKVDWNISSGRRLSGRYTWDDLDWQFPLFYGTAAEPDGRSVLIPRNSASLQYTDSLSPTLLLDAKLGFNRENEHFSTPSEGFDITTLGFPAAFARETMVGRGADTGRFPQFNITDQDRIGAIASRGNPSQTTQESIAVTKVTSRHTWKAGFEHRFYARNDWGRELSAGTYSFTRGFTQGPNPLQASATAGYGVASLLLGTAASGSARTQTDATASVNYYGMFVQDDWKVTPTLTLNLGLRWDRDGPVTDRYNVITLFDPNASVPGIPSVRGGLAFAGVGGQSRGATDPDYNDFQPRFGFAWQARPKTVIRGGIGIMFVPTTPSGSVGQTGFLNDTPMVATIDGGLTPRDKVDNPFPNGLLQPTGSSLGAATGLGTGVSGQLRDVQRGYSQQWNFTVQHEPWKNWLVEVAWVGNKGTRLLGFSRQLNQISDETFALGTALAQSVPNPYRGAIATGPLAAATITRLQSLRPYPQFTNVNGGYSFLNNSIYHAMAVKVEKRMSSGLSLLMAYTLSKLIDDGSNSSQVRPGGTVVTTPQNWNNLRAERSLSAEDVPHRLVFSAVWELPFAKTARGVERFVLGGWQLNAITTMESGTPVSLSASVAGGGNRPNVVAGQSGKLDSPAIGRWFDTSAFSNPLPYTYGNVSRTLPNVRKDGVFNQDLSLFKRFPVREGMNVEFRAEAFNLTNSPSFETPGRALNSATFGVVTATAFYPKPREFQLALRLLF